MYELCNKVTLEEMSVLLSLRNLLALVPQKSEKWVLIQMQLHCTGGVVKSVALWVRALLNIEGWCQQGTSMQLCKKKKSKLALIWPLLGTQLN